jgi:hypothetical protein
MNTPWQAKPVPGTRRRRVTGEGEELRKTAAPRAQRPVRAGSAARRAPLPAAGRSDQRKSSGRSGRAPGMRKAGQQARPREGMSATARTWSSPTAAQPLGRPVALDAVEPMLRMNKRRQVVGQGLVALTSKLVER